MKIYYVRPQCDAGYGTGDGTSYQNAWNGFGAVDWSVLHDTNSVATLWVCGAPDGPKGFLTVNVEWSYLAESPEDTLGLPPQALNA